MKIHSQGWPPIFDPTAVADLDPDEIRQVEQLGSKLYELLPPEVLTQMLFATLRHLEHHPTHYDEPKLRASVMAFFIMNKASWLKDWQGPPTQTE